MNVSVWTKKFHFSLPVITWTGFLLVLGIFWGYTFLFKDAELSTQDLLRSEIQYLREKNRQLAARNQELERDIVSIRTGNGEIQQNPEDPLHAVPGLEAAKQRSFRYTVKRGDTIWDIAAIYNVDVKALMQWNHLTPRSRIFPGDQLIIILDE